MESDSSLPRLQDSPQLL